MRLFVSTLPRSYRSATLQVALAAGLLAWASNLPAQSLEGAVPGPATSAPAASAPAAHATPHPTSAPAPVAPAEKEKSNITPVEKATGTVTGTGVYVRPTPAANTYRLAQLKKDETVEIVGTANGWYQILPPAGVYCVIVKEYVDAAADGKSATVKADFVNVRAGSALDPERVDFVVNKVRKGTKLNVLGSADIGGVKYLKIAPPEGTVVYISSQFVKLPAGTTLVPAKGPQTLAPALIPREEIIDLTPAIETPVATTTQSGTPVAQTKPAATEPATQIVVAPAPATNFAKGSFEKFSELNKKTIEELRKAPVKMENAGTLLDEWTGFLKTENLPPSIAQAGKERIASLEKAIAIQKIAKEVESGGDLEARRKALQDEYKAAIDKVKVAEAATGYLAEGVLEASDQVTGSYRLVSPETGRTTAYVLPSSEFPLEKLLGQYVGVRGSYIKKDNGVQQINASSATLIPAPKVGS